LFYCEKSTKFAHFLPHKVCGQSTDFKYSRPTDGQLLKRKVRGLSSDSRASVSRQFTDFAFEQLADQGRIYRGAHGARAPGLRKQGASAD